LEGQTDGPQPLFNQNQMRVRGVHVQDNLYDGHITISDEEVKIPMSSVGTNIFAKTKTPTQQELDEYPHIHQHKVLFS